MNAESSPDSKCSSIDHLRNSQLKLETPGVGEVDTTKSLEVQEQEKTCRSKELKEKAKENEQPSQENSRQSVLPQYLYVQPAAGMDCSEN